MPLYRIQKISPDGIWSSVGMEFATLDDARRAKVRDAADQYRIVQVKTYVLLSIPNDPDDDPPARYIKLIPELHDADILTCNEVEEVVPVALGKESRDWRTCRPCYWCGELEPISTVCVKSVQKEA